jgi:hypothetical protein
MDQRRVEDELIDIKPASLKQHARRQQLPVLIAPEGDVELVIGGQGEQYARKNQRRLSLVCHSPPRIAWASFSLNPKKYQVKNPAVAIMGLCQIDPALLISNALLMKPDAKDVFL